MSHFSLAVLHYDYQDVDSLLEPYDEGIVVAPYVFMTHEEVIEKAKGRVAKWEGLPPEELSDSQEKIMSADTDEKLFSEYAKYCGYDRINEKGDVLTTYNPDSKYDYYTVEGRSLYTKDGEECGEAKVNDVQFGIIDSLYHEAIDFWNNTINGSERSYYNKEYYIDKYKTAENYAKEVSIFSTYAVVTPDGVWHSPGDVGWFGMSSETEDEWGDWVSNYYERFFKDADPDLILTMVDCHI